jgi:hypothetical protein
MILGNSGPVFVKSAKQKIVSKSSTEAELVALSDSASQGLHLRNFLTAQGYDIPPVVLHQDNQSAMALVFKGGPASERSRHINIRYFWVCERIANKEAKIVWCPTEVMWANLLTKPLQGSQFTKECKAVTGW